MDCKFNVVPEKGETSLDCMRRIYEALAKISQEVYGENIMECTLSTGSTGDIKDIHNMIYCTKYPLIYRLRNNKIYGSVMFPNSVISKKVKDFLYKAGNEVKQKWAIIFSPEANSYFVYHLFFVLIFDTNDELLTHKDQFSKSIKESFKDENSFSIKVYNCKVDQKHMYYIGLLSSVNPVDYDEYSQLFSEHLKVSFGAYNFYNDTFLEICMEGLLSESDFITEDILDMIMSDSTEPMEKIFRKM